MKSDIYNLVTVKDGKSDNAEIVRVFSEIAAGRLKSDLKLLNYVDEVPVSFGATINIVERESVELEVHEHQAVIIKRDNSTLIKSRHFYNGLSVHCYAAYVNVPKKIVILHNFAYAQIRAERREAVRVKLHGKLPVKFSYENVKIVGYMVDISANGVSICSSSVPSTETGQSGLLNFTISGNSLEVSGTFVKIATKGDDGDICVFQMEPDMKTDAIIGLFIYQRQVEIIQLLKEGLVVE